MVISGISCSFELFTSESKEPSLEVLRWVLTKESATYQELGLGGCGNCHPSQKQASLYMCEVQASCHPDICRHDQKTGSFKISGAGEIAL